MNTSPTKFTVRLPSSAPSCTATRQVSPPARFVASRTTRPTVHGWLAVTVNVCSGSGSALDWPSPKSQCQVNWSESGSKTVAWKRAVTSQASARTFRWLSMV